MHSSRIIYTNSAYICHLLTLSGSSPASAQTVCTAAVSYSIRVWSPALEPRGNCSIDAAIMRAIQLWTPISPSHHGSMRYRQPPHPKGTATRLATVHQITANIVSPIPTIPWMCRGIRGKFRYHGAISLHHTWTQGLFMLYLLVYYGLYLPWTSSRTSSPTSEGVSKDELLWSSASNFSPLCPSHLPFAKAFVSAQPLLELRQYSASKPLKAPTLLGQP